MTKLSLGLAALMLSSAAIGAPAHPSKLPAADVVVFSEAADAAALHHQWRADFVTQGSKKTPPYDAQVRLYQDGHAAPAQTISLHVRVAPQELFLRMPDLDGDGHADLVVSSTLDRVYREPADVVYLYSPKLERFVLTRELSRIGFVHQSTVPGCVMTETTCGATSVEVGQMCRTPSGRWVAMPNTDAVCEDRD